MFCWKIDLEVQALEYKNAYVQYWQLVSSRDSFLAMFPSARNVSQTQQKTTNKTNI